MLSIYTCNYSLLSSQFLEPLAWILEKLVLPIATKLKRLVLFFPDISGLSGG